MENKGFSTFGQHIITDLYGVDEGKLDSSSFLVDHLTRAIELSGAHLAQPPQVEKFEPQGVTALFLLTESHLSIHTYPEHGYCSVDCYTCGTTCKPEKAINYILEILNPTRYESVLVTRGIGKLVLEGGK